MRFLLAFFALSLTTVQAGRTPNTYFDPPEGAPEGWKTGAPLEELAPSFSYDRDKDRFISKGQGSDGVHGFWEKTFPVQGGGHYRFEAARHSESIPYPRRSAVVEIEWQDDKGNSVESPHRVNPEYFGKTTITARTDYPRDKETSVDGWTSVNDTYLAPDKATRAVLTLRFRWAARGTLSWRNVSFSPSDPPAARKVRLAAVHYYPQAAATPLEVCRQFAPFVEEAARKNADLVVLGETITVAGVKPRPAYPEVAETIPGPSTRYFGTLAKKHGLYIVVGLMEKDPETGLAYNVAVLIDPEGVVAGKYRKVSLPRSENISGLVPGDSYPVFDTEFGKLGMMVCYDAFFPEVARRLALNGAEVIALPVWGCNPALAAARCVENGVYLVSSTYTDPKHQWMKTAIWDREGKRLATADHQGQVIVTEVDLAEPTIWGGLGDFQSRIARDAPIWKAEKAAP
ncbi:MAG: carbon-nitrogen hydrolase family protein [Verrucomicrobiales bacterium]